MIKTGILGGDSHKAGELIRLLVLHPEVELLFVVAPALRGQAISSFHRGMIGETDLKFSDSFNPEDLNMLFVTDVAYLSDSFPESLKVVVYADDQFASLSDVAEGSTFVPAVSEMFRKPLVRGAKSSMVMPSCISVAMIALFPLALHLMLNESLSVKVNLPKFKSPVVSEEVMEKEIVRLLNLVQLSFDKFRGVKIENSNLLRTISLELELDSDVDEEEIKRIYNSIYDDHNFTFVVRTEPAPTEVAGTQKCLIYVHKSPEGKIRIKALADSFLRGGAGDAIHAMNLLFGLYEKTGLSLPASMAFKHNEFTPEEA